MSDCPVVFCSSVTVVRTIGPRDRALQMRWGLWGQRRLLWGLGRFEERSQDSMERGRVDALS